MAKNNNNGQLCVGQVGMGPVGSTLAAHLIEAGAFVVPCDVIHEKTDRIRESGIHLRNTIEKDVEVTDACYSVQELGSYDLDLVSISVKTPYLKSVLTELSEIASDKTFIMSSQNGIDNEREVARVFGDKRTLRMVINYAGGMSDLNTVNVTFFNPPNYIAALAPEGESIAQKVVELLNSVKLSTEITENIQHYVWEKAILNAALAPVCGIVRKTMKDVMDSPDGLEIVQSIIDESVRVADAEGIRFGEDFRQFCIEYLKKGGYHRPSMLIDLENGLPTEIDHLNGRIVEYGRKHSIPTPVNSSISALIRMLESGSKTRR